VKTHSIYWTLVSVSTLQVFHVITLYWQLLIYYVY